MTDAQTYAWIFLTVRETPTSLKDVIATADGINHAIPMLEELQTSFGWLQAQGLVRKEGKEGRNYLLTEAGAALAKSVSHKRYIFDQWDAIKAKFSQMPDVAVQPDDISEAEWRSACRAWNKQAREIIRKLNGKK